MAYIRLDSRSLRQELDKRFQTIIRELLAGLSPDQIKKELHAAVDRASGGYSEGEAARRAETKKTLDPTTGRKLAVRAGPGSFTSDIRVVVFTKSGEWYLWAKCRSCSGAIPIIMCPAPPAPAVTGEESFTFRGVPCRHCGAKADYAMAELERRQEIG
jgi:hypothetical protein